MTRHKRTHHRADHTTHTHYLSQARGSSTAAYAAHYAMGFQPVFDGFRIATGAPPVVPVRERVAAARDSADKARRAATALAERLRDANDDG